MNDQQFAVYAQGIERIALENRQTAQQAAQRLELSKLLAKVILQMDIQLQRLAYG